ncbi:MAG: TonB-dependent receptor, partial [Flavisolibacter sp.]
MKKFIFLCLSVCFVQLLQAQSRIRTSLSGLVTDARSGQPLQGASVILSDSRTGTTTDSSGRYVLNNIPGGHSIIEISYSGYRTQVVHLDISLASEEKNFALLPTILENEGVTITAVANATSIRNAPIPITRMSKKDLLSASASNIIDALGRQPGITQLSTGPAISKPIIRGLGYNRLVVINDGVRQEGQQWGDEHGIEMDEHSVQRIEIVKGPASLIYGSDAIAGVINIITTSPVPVNTIRGNVLMNYQTNNRH